MMLWQHHQAGVGNLVPLMVPNLEVMVKPPAILENLPAFWIKKDVSFRSEK